MRRVQALNVAKYSIIDLAPFLENKLYQYLQLDPEEDEQVEDEWEKEHSVFSAKHLIKYGLSLTSYAILFLSFSARATWPTDNRSDAHVARKRVVATTGRRWRACSMCLSTCSPPR
jgi:hypothetical protein